MTTEPKKTVQDAWARWAIEQLQIKLSTLGGGFDPNEDPVIIGSGASGAGGSTPTSPNVADSGSVILGLNAFGPGIAIGNTASAGASGAVAIGDSSGATTDCVAIGNGANSTHRYAIAIGTGSAAGATSTNGCVAVGWTASSTGLNSVAIGTGATVSGSHSVALGAGATASFANQIVLGTSADTVVLYSLDASHLPTTNPGVGSKLVWNNSGVLTVA